MRKILLLIIYGWVLSTVFLQAQSLHSKELEIYPIEENVWVHVTYLGTEKWGRVACNGMIYKVGNEVVVFDTPITDEVSDMLIRWIQNELRSEISAVIINHHHIDCLGGLAAFHTVGIDSFGHPAEINLAKERSGISIRFPQATEGIDTLKIGNETIINFYPGPAHTQGSLISYLPQTHTIFGGCQIKSLNAGKGNLDDADTLHWASSIERVKRTFPEIKKVIPGHGRVGSTDLLDYTIELFRASSN